ncbi:NAD(+) diphosphatase [Roseovarius sp. SCSIO 43702]|uniref:NAD(+) diphosphatase n=1 Tax=Roseovarius sp. SCSIO 43702 TaxID=2823043 RepID=UPI001C73ABEE|nr:NAD(+) diphosphatase [Roseovarius sp. SCSIO 43702]QYX56403.1 NAD(+) diphosphatase [Roseovarius sp. SCSIO 43702]
MRLAETVTFGGSRLDRAAELRGRDDALRREVAAHGAEMIVLWRGKPLVEPEAPGGGARLVRLGPDHPVLTPEMPRFLLGREATGRLVFACDLSDWEPEGETAQTGGGFLDETVQRHPRLPDSQAFWELRRLLTRLDTRDAELAATAKALHAWHHSHRFCAACGMPSEISQAGWQRTCPACRAHHFPRTDPVVIMLITHGNDVLLGRSPGWPDGMYSLLAGFVEPGETVEAAVRREVREETRIEVGEVEYLSSQPWPFPASLMIGCAGRATSTDIIVDPVEIEAALWVSREDLTEAMAGAHPSIKPARAGAIAHFLLSNWLADTLD